MAEEDFDVDSLASYLHILPAQISRLADRGKLPGRKVAGQWQFSRAEIHHWLEQRIGLSDDEELIHMEEVLQHSGQPTTEHPVVMSELLSVDAIAVPLQARTRGSVITEMTKLAARTGLLWDADKMAAALKAREQMHPTALDIGVALMHPRRPQPNLLGQALLALGITPSRIPFAGERGVLTDVFFLICSVEDQGHLRVLARLSRLISTPGFLTNLREAKSPQEAYELIAEYDNNLE